MKRIGSTVYHSAIFRILQGRSSMIASVAAMPSSSRYLSTRVCQQSYSRLALQKRWGDVNRSWNRYRVLYRGVWMGGCRCVSASDGSGEVGDEGGFEGEYVSLPESCPGCGVKLQIDDPDLPGYCKVPQKIIDMLTYGVEEEVEDDEAILDDEGEGFDEGFDEDFDMEDDLEDGEGFVRIRLDGDEEGMEDFNSMIDSLNMLEVMDAGGGSKPAGQKKRAEPAPMVFESDETEDIFSDLVCARCYSLKHYGKVKSEEAELSLPDFDVAKVVGEAIRSRQFRRAIVLVVVDLADFDGSLPRLTIQSMLEESLGKSGEMAVKGERANFKLIIAANKSDLLPRQATTARLEQWVRKRITQGGLPRPSSVHIVSSHSSFGVRSLIVDLQKSLMGGSGGDVWVVGAQNAGKSSLINAMQKAVKVGRTGGKKAEVTAAPMPGTTLGVVPVSGGIVPKGCDMLDTPGVRHEYQLTSNLSFEEVRMILPRRSLKPRTYRLGEGQTIHMGGLGRVDIITVPGATMYITVWASDDIRTHLGKTKNAEQFYSVHAGKELVPPVAADEQDRLSRIESIGNMKATDVIVEGDSWKQSSVDVCIAGLGWISVGVNGKAELKVWAPPGVAITSRDALIPDMAKEFCRPGFDASIPSQDKNTKVKSKKKKVKK
jgi:ribosome biogenesis GTPase A